MLNLYSTPSEILSEKLKTPQHAKRPRRVLFCNYEYARINANKKNLTQRRRDAKTRRKNFKYLFSFFGTLGIGWMDFYANHVIICYIFKINPTYKTVICKTKFI